MTSQGSITGSNHALQRYYASLESRIGYRLVLGGTRHYGYYQKDTFWPFSINQALRAMEDHLFHSLGLEKDAYVLDAGCGSGHVAIYLGQRGLRVQGIDVVDRHLQQALRNIKATNLESTVDIKEMDYHHLGSFADETFDGVYTMETLAHATNPQAVLLQFYAVLKPGGTLAIYDYDHMAQDLMPEDVKQTVTEVTEYASLPSAATFEYGVLERFLVQAGFVDVEVRDLSLNILPMMRLFFVLAYIPYLFVQLLGLQSRFVNTVAAVECYGGRKYGRYIAVSARKPSKSSNASGAIRGKEAQTAEDGGNISEVV